MHKGCHGMQHRHRSWLTQLCQVHLHCHFGCLGYDYRQYCHHFWATVAMPSVSVHAGTWSMRSWLRCHRLLLLYCRQCLTITLCIACPGLKLATHWFSKITRLINDIFRRIIQTFGPCRIDAFILNTCFSLIVKKLPLACSMTCQFTTHGTSVFLVAQSVSVSLLAGEQIKLSSSWM